MAGPLTLAFSAALGIVTYSFARFIARTELAKCKTEGEQLWKGVGFSIGAAFFPTLFAAGALGADEGALVLAGQGRNSTLAFLPKS